MFSVLHGAVLKPLSCGEPDDLAAAVFFSRALGSLVHQAGALEADILAVSLAVTVGAALLACVVRARKASRTEAVEALRME